MNPEGKKIQIVLNEGVQKAEVVLREGEAVKELELKPPIKTGLAGVIGAPFEYLKKRINEGQFAINRSHLIVDRERISLSLVFNEDDAYLRGQVDGKLEMHPSFVKFGVNTSKVWAPAELGLFFKMNRAFFPDRKSNMELVATLMTFSATVNTKLDRYVKENGDRSDNFVQIVNSNLPSSFTLIIPVFKGMPAEKLEVETFANISGREVAFTLVSPGANQLLEDIRNKVVDEQLALFIELAPQLAIIEV
jgi:hypothetical protein